MVGQEQGFRKLPSSQVETQQAGLPGKEVPDGDVWYNSLCDCPVELNIQVLRKKERNGSAQAALCRSMVLGAFAKYSRGHLK